MSTHFRQVCSNWPHRVTDRHNNNDNAESTDGTRTSPAKDASHSQPSPIAPTSIANWTTGSKQRPKRPRVPCVNSPTHGRTTSTTAATSWRKPPATGRWPPRWQLRHLHHPSALRRLRFSLLTFDATSSKQLSCWRRIHSAGRRSLHARHSRHQAMAAPDSSRRSGRGCVSPGAGRWRDSMGSGQVTSREQLQLEFGKWWKRWW